MSQHSLGPDLVVAAVDAAINHEHFFATLQAWDREPLDELKRANENVLRDELKRFQT